MAKLHILQRIDRWHKTKLGLAVFMLFEAAFGYLFASLAAHSGSLLDYVIAFLLIVLFVQDAVAFIMKGTERSGESKGKEKH
jgi:hypothetical protein